MPPVSDAVDTAIDTAVDTAAASPDPQPTPEVDAAAPPDDSAVADRETPAAPEQPAKPPRPKPSSIERIDRLTARARAAEEEARYWRERAQQSAAPAAPAAPAPDQPRPSRENFDNPDDYDAAIVEWASERAARKVQTEQRQAEEQRRVDDARSAAERAQREEADRVRQSWSERRAAFAAKTPDYAEIAEAQPDDGGPVISEPMAAAIMLADNGPEVAYWLGQHPEEAARIAQMTRGAYPAGHPLAGQPMPDFAMQTYELGRIAGQLAQAVAPRAPMAPVPITPVRSGATAVRKTPDEESMEEYWSRRSPEMRRGSQPH